MNHAKKMFEDDLREAKERKLSTNSFVQQAGKKMSHVTQELNTLTLFNDSKGDIFGKSVLSSENHKRFS